MNLVSPSKTAPGRKSEDAARLQKISLFHADLARRIVTLARDRKCIAGCQLKEQWLSRELGVSRSPVRSALRLLTDRGIVKSVPNQGCFLAVSLDQLETRDWDIPPTEEERLYLEISRDRFANRLPRRINVTELVRHYGTSRSMIGRVLNRLADEGLLERDPGRRWSFPPALTEANVYDESYRFRMMIEPQAILEPGFAIDRSRFQKLRRAHEALLAEGLHPGLIRQSIDIDAEFHETIGACSGNRFLSQSIQQQTRLRRFSDYQMSTARERLEESCREHLRILDAIEAGDMKTAARLMHQHIAVSENIRPSFEAAGQNKA